MISGYLPRTSLPPNFSLDPPLSYVYSSSTEEMLKYKANSSPPYRRDGNINLYKKGALIQIIFAKTRQISCTVTKYRNNNEGVDGTSYVIPLTALLME